MAAVQTFRSNSTEDQFKILVTNPKAVPRLHRIELTVLLIGLSVLTVSAMLIYLYTIISAPEYRRFALLCIRSHITIMRL